VVQRVRELTQGRGVAVAYDGVGKDSFSARSTASTTALTLVNFGQASGAVPPFEVSRLAARSNTVSRPIIFHYVREAAQREEMAANVFRALEEGWLKSSRPARSRWPTRRKAIA
jgi:NADPH2:quinone reductase